MILIKKIWCVVLHKLCFCCRMTKKQRKKRNPPHHIPRVTKRHKLVWCLLSTCNFFRIKFYFNWGYHVLKLYNYLFEHFFEKFFLGSIEVWTLSYKFFLTYSAWDLGLVNLLIFKYSIEVVHFLKQTTYIDLDGHFL